MKQLLKEHCPNGVEYKTLGEIAVCYTGATPKTGIAAYWENGTIPWMSSGEVNKGEVYSTEKKITQLAYDSCSTKLVPPNTVVIALAGQGKTRGTVAITRISLCTNQSLCSILPDKTVDSEYLYHFLKSQYQHLRAISSGDGTRGGLNLKMIKSYKIPVPPMEVQWEIVRILDHFTELTTELEEKLTAELTARKKQYEYYRDKVFALKECTFLRIRDFATTNIGLATSVTKHKASSGVLLLHNSDIQQNALVLKSTEYITEDFAKKNYKKILHIGDIITVHTGDVGTSAVIDEKYAGAIGFTTITTHINDTTFILPKYLCHYLNSHKCKMDIASMTISDRNNLNQKNYENLVIPIPSLEEQRRIVSILDRFDALCNDLTSGLPAEIEARKKQYEYYRDKLLTFQEAKR